jgi:hypothetical protein
MLKTRLRFLANVELLVLVVFVVSLRGLLSFEEALRRLVFGFSVL